MFIIIKDRYELCSSVIRKADVIKFLLQVTMAIQAGFTLMSVSSQIFSVSIFIKWLRNKLVLLSLSLPRENLLEIAFSKMNGQDLNFLKWCNVAKCKWSYIEYQKLIQPLLMGQYWRYQLL